MNDRVNPWTLCFEEAWKSYCKGSIPIGAVIVSQENDIISKGRNMVFEETEDNCSISNCKLGHAEINAIYASKVSLSNAIIYSTMEPCVMCFGAIIMNGIKEIRFAARDGLAGGVNLSNDFISQRKIKISQHNEKLEIVQIALYTEFIYRKYPDNVKRLLDDIERTCCIGISIGKKWYDADYLVNLVNLGGSMNDVLEQCEIEIQSYTHLP